MAKMFLKVALLCLVCRVTYGEIFDSFTGCLINDTKLEEYEEADIVETCTNDIVLPCDPTEGRRLDGTCNNLNNPQRGGFHTPLMRILPADFVYGDEPVDTACGIAKPNPREARRKLLAEGKSVDPEFTQLLLYLSVALFMDTGSIHDSFNYLNETLYCCKEEGKSDHQCTPNIIPTDDGVHRWSGIQCMNMTRPKSFESYGCLQKESGLNRIEFVTTCMDLSSIYASELPIPSYRMNESGMIMYDEDDGTTWPPHEGPNQDHCFQNNATAGETRCFGPTSPSIFPVQLATVFFWNLHNLIAREIATLNPCWDDDKLFETTRDINIALITQILFHEMAPLFVGRKALIEAGIISESEGLRKLYDEDLVPGIYLEYPYAMRTFHTIQEATIKLYDDDYNFCGEIPMVNMSLRVGKMAIDGNMAKITRGSFLQPAAQYDRMIDPDIVEIGLGGLQLATDLATSDLHKGRLFGLPPYIEYLEYFHGVKITTWSDLREYMDEDNIEIMQEVYKCVEAIDLLSGLWLEKRVEGGFTSVTTAAILIKQFEHIVKSDRHYYENEDRPNAFTEAQLSEVRKMTVARLVCSAGTGVTKIQTEAFKRVSESNPLVSCDEIPTVDLTAWKDDSCDCSK